MSAKSQKQKRFNETTIPHSRNEIRTGPSLGKLNRSWNKTPSLERMHTGEINKKLWVTTPRVTVNLFFFFSVLYTLTSHSVLHKATWHSLNLLSLVWSWTRCSWLDNLSSAPIYSYLFLSIPKLFYFCIISSFFPLSFKWGASPAAIWSSIESAVSVICDPSSSHKRGVDCFRLVPDVSSSQPNYSSWWIGYYLMFISDNLIITSPDVNRNKRVAETAPFSNSVLVPFYVQTPNHFHVFGFYDPDDLCVIKTKKPMVLCKRSTSRSREQSTKHRSRSENMWKVCLFYSQN